MNDESPADLRVLTKAFALAVVRLFTTLPRTEEARVLGRQMLRSGTSVGAHYREACRARSKAEFVSKLEVGNQELDETMYWIELLMETGFITETKNKELHQQASQILAMQTASIKTTKARMSGS